MHLRLETFDGTVFEADTTMRTFMCTADRIRFRNLFGVSAAEMSEWQHDLTKIREDWMVWFVWRELCRRVGDLPPFDEILDTVIDCELDMEPAVI